MVRQGNYQHQPYGAQVSLGPSHLDFTREMVLLLAGTVANGIGRMNVEVL
ncbi:hypothetical protein SAMD00023353_0203710 [Rosellinia necatrix]|uniref:Uncharacterized protein n=1 Tax=Rosellinia necatrix TaxID=77044 RepID=A0A1S8A577_ROSNE|nr:hypothetical protein SAMD00023353_0203710 [Rosellinia necatrix]